MHAHYLPLNISVTLFGIPKTNATCTGATFETVTQADAKNEHPYSFELYERVL